MAPPSNRRPGQNRRAQYGLFASYVIAVIGALGGLLLFIVSLADPTGFAVIRNALAEVTRPVSATMRSLVSGVGNIDEEVAAYIGAGSQNAALRRQVEANRTRLIEAAAIEQENARLKKLLNLVEGRGREVVAARLISSSSSSTRRLARLNAGSFQGVSKGQPVRAPQGLIGRIFSVGPNSSEVLMLTDPENIIPVRRARDDVAATSIGLADGTLDIRALGMDTNPFKPGDILVTSGTGGLYAPNVPVAIVVRIKGDSALAVPLANPARVEMVIVEHAYQPTVAPRPPVVVPTLPPAAAAAPASAPAQTAPTPRP